MVWTNADNEKIAIAVSNFRLPIDFPSTNNVPYLVLFVGDVVDVKKEENVRFVFLDWYYGHLRIDVSKAGIFPKNYVIIKDSTFAEDKDRNSNSSTTSGNSASATSVCNSIVRETTIVLRQWMRIAKQLYSDRKQIEYSPLISMMKDLLDWRKKVLDGKLPIDRLQELKLKMSRKIDVGNKKLGLDLVIRHDNGNIVELDSCSLMDLYELHCSANNRIQNDSKTNSTHSTNHQTQGNWCLLVNISDFLIRTPADAEVFLSLYDGVTHHYISEFFTVYLPFSSDEFSSTSGGTLLLRRSSSVPGGFVGAKLLFTDFGNKDTERKKVFLVCKVVKFGPYDSSSIPKKASASTCVRQTYAVGALDISDTFNGSAYANDDSNSLTEIQELGGFIQLHVCESKFEEMLQRILEGRTGTLTGTPAPSNQNGAIGNHSGDTRDQGIWLSVQRLWGNVDEVLGSESFPSAPVVLRKLGFPEVISREDVRNDMYITLTGGDFKESGKERNIEVKVSLVNQLGDVYPDSFVSLSIVTKKDQHFVSTVFQHDHRPRWNDMFKLAIPVDKYNDLHLRFTFKHRSSNESKDKAEKPFALSYIRLIQTNGTILTNGDYDLNVYKTDKKFDDTHVTYLDLPSTKSDLDQLITASSLFTNGHYTSKNANLHNSLFTLCSKDVFHLKSVVCSTSLTQNVELLGLLGWESKQINLKDSLQMIMKLESDKIGAEIVKFLHDILDVLFNILTTTEVYDELAFDALVYIIALVDEKRFHSFKPVMDTYLKKSFSAIQVHLKLLDILNRYICNVEKYDNKLFLALKSLDYLMKFVVQSRYLFTKSLISGETNDVHLFEDRIRDIYDSLTKLLSLPPDKNNLKYQAAALKYVHFTVNEVITVFEPTKLADLLIKMLNKSPLVLNVQRLTYIKHLVNLDIFKKVECRKQLLPEFLTIIQKFMENNEELELCSAILTDIMKVLYSKPPEECQTESTDLITVVRIILRSLMQLIIRLPELKPMKVEISPSALKPVYVALLMEIFNQLDASSCGTYISSFVNLEDLMDFTIELFMLFKDLIENLPFSTDWFSMITFQNSVILKILGFMSSTVRLRFSNPFKKDVYDNFFLTCVSFIVQKHLQTETFDPSKRLTMLKRYRDMRYSCAKEIRNLWYQMNHLKKAEFIPSLVGPMLRVTLIPQSELRQQTIPIFLDMIITGLYHKPKSDAKDTSICKSKFVEFEHELILQLDYLVDNGSGDSDYTDSFTSIMEKHLLTHKDDRIKQTGSRLTVVVKRLMNRLLEFRDVKQNHNCTDNSMSCLYSLLEFYREIQQTELYVRYLYKLYDLHMSCENFVEAAWTLNLHADQLLNWSEDSVPEELRSQEKFRDSDGLLKTRRLTERQLKENLYYQIICLYDKGKLWEKAIDVCKELQEQYEQNTLEYEKLSDLLERMSKMYKNIMNEQRSEPEYFRTGFYGRGFPTFLQNRVFVYRGQPYERIADFSSRMKSQFPKGILMASLAPPTEEQMASTEQYLQIVSVKTVVDEHPKISVDRNVASKIEWYYKYNDVQKFTYSRRLPSRQSDIDFLGSLNETEKQVMIWMEQTVLVTSYAFPGVLRYFPVTSSKTTEISPLQIAIDQMKGTVKDVAQTVEECERLGEKLVNTLALKLQGIINPAVQGGITNYERTFLTESFVSKCSEKELQYIDQLKDAIASQIPLLEKGIFIHAKQCAEDQRSFHEFLIKSFDEYRKRVEERYGKKPSLLPPDVSIHITKPKPLTKHFSVDNTPDERFGSYPTLPRSSNKRDNTAGPFTVRNVGIATVPRRVHTKRKPAQSSGSQTFNENDANKRLSNTSIGSNNSVDSVQALKNGPIMEIGETATPQRPLRPSVSSASSRRPSNSQPLKDRQPSAVFHRPYTSVDGKQAFVGEGSLGCQFYPMPEKSKYPRTQSPTPFEDRRTVYQDIDITPVSTPIVNNAGVFASAEISEKPPPLPARPPPKRNNSLSVGSLADQLNSFNNNLVPSPRTPTSLGHDFVMPRKNKPLPPKP